VDEDDVTQILTLLAETLPSVDIDVEVRDAGDAPATQIGRARPLRHV
jgi:hypothetical protein